uniref:C-type lectin domain-containing protein n=1 Tax=Plectus sambesii TaxID=2011161 RepID=A0A914VIY4_9BILA
MNPLLIFGTLLLVGSTEAASCPSAWVTWQDSCYLFSKDVGTWQDTEQECISQGSHLASIHSAFENNFIFEKAHQQFSGEGKLWIGGGNFQTSSELYAWSDQTPFDYQAWTSGEPSKHGQNGVVMIYENIGLRKGEWLSKNPDDKYPFVCKKSPS